MTILVTGATGYIGKEFIRQMQSRYNIIALVRDTSKTDELKAFNCKIITFSDYKKILNIFKQNSITGVVHFASNVITNHKNNDIKELIDSNITFGTELLEACQESNVKWFINTGTFWQNYENRSYNPVNLYSATKEAFEDIAKFYSQTSSLIFITIKLNDTFGPNDTRNKIFNIWNKISKSGELLEMSLGEQIVDISYIDDVVGAYITMIDNLTKKDAYKYKNKTFVVSNMEKLSLKELSNLFENITKNSLNIKWGGRKYRDREVMIPYTRGESVPNWKQQFGLENAIENTIRNMNND